MNPMITTITDNENTLLFTIKDINVSLANALRRVILTEIPIIVFRTFPYTENKANFEINTSRFNNEIIKQRLSCIPIHIVDDDFPLEDYIVEIDVNNDTGNIIYVTTKDFKIKNIHTNKYLTEATTKQIFPPNNLTNSYIDFIRLRPKLSDNIPGEQLKMSCSFSRGIAKENGMFNVVSTGSYGGTVDSNEVTRAWKEKEKELKSSMSKDEIELIKKDWLLLDGKRLIIPDSFDFIIESVGIYSNLKICELGCKVLIAKLQNLAQTIQSNPIIKEANNTISNCYDITLENEDFTLGKIIEYVLYEKYFDNEITFCGFRKPHPHLNYSILRIASRDELENTEIIRYILTACEINISIFEKLLPNFTG